MTNFDNNIVFQGVRTHNLKNIDITLPKNQLITITGVSGSGKSSLAFDTIYKEGQFRYIESLSSYLRQFFNLGSRPEVDYSAGLSPAIAIEQNKRVGNMRSTVGTLTEIDDYLRLLFAKLGELYCYKCGSHIKAQTNDQIIDDIKTHFLDKKIYVLQELHTYKTAPEFLKFVKKNKNKVEEGEGFVRYLIVLNYEDNVKLESGLEDDVKKGIEEQGVSNIIEYFYLEDPKIPNDAYPIKVYGIFDRITIEESKLQRLKEDIIKILSRVDKFGVYLVDEDKKVAMGNIRRYTDKNFCANCNITYPEFTTQHFSPNRQEGACEICHGIGETLQVDFTKIIDPNSQFIQSVLPWRDSAMGQEILSKLASKYGIDKSVLWKDVPQWFKDVVMNGDGELLRLSFGGGKYSSMHYKGMEDVLTQQYYKGVLTVDFQAMLNLRSCPECGGSKLKKESLNVFLELTENVDTESLETKSKTTKKKTKKSDEVETDDPKKGNIKRYNLFDFQNKPLTELIELLGKYKNTTSKPLVLVERIANPLLDRAKTIDNLGLGYLNIYRPIDTLSGGEIQRLRLAKQLGNKLTGIVYVLDEPTIGLDENEIKKVIESIKTLREMGNTIVVVEHNDEFIKNSDWVVEIGPGAGDFGGNVIFNGPYEEFLKSNTLTAQYVKGKKSVTAEFDHTPSKKLVKILKASKHNLKSIDVNINLGSFTIITGPSGAGKTTLMYHTLFRFLSEKEKFVQSYIRLSMLKKGMSWSEIIAAPVMKPEEYEHYENLAIQEFLVSLGVESISGHENIKNVMYIDQSSIGKTPRSCPATFIGLFDDIRTIFAGVEHAKMLGFSSGHFSFNSGKGACPECDGYGYKHIELQFLPDTYVPCELCKGRRYKPDILSVKWKGKDISEILSMYVKDAADFFQDIHFIKQQLDLMVEIGLGYLKLGQPAHTLSGGESQRLKLVKNLLKTYKGHTVYFLDEPTVGLHPSDIEKLLKVLKRFLDKGDTILMIEHERNLLKFADHVIKLDNGNLI